MKLIDKLLFIYSSLMAVVLTVSSLRGGFSTQNLVMITLFLPVTGYFIFLFVKAYYRRQYRREHLRKHRGANLPAPSLFSLKHFFRQKDPLFIVTLCLYFALLSVVIAKAVITL